MKNVILCGAGVLLGLAIAGCGGGGSSSSDTTQPMVTATDPADSESSVVLLPAISVTFSEAMDQASAEAAFSSVPPLPAGSFSWTDATMTFTPAAALDEVTEYVITVDAGATDAAGNPLAGAYTWSWTTLDATPPEVTETEPLDGDIGLDPLTAIAVTFSEAMDQASAEAALSAVPALPAGSFSWADATMTFTPDSPLDASTEYSITVGVGATDAAGNPLAAAYAWGMRTGLGNVILDLQSDFASPTGNDGVVASADGQYIFWWDGTEGEGGGCNIHLYRVRISDGVSQTIWTNRSLWNIYDDGEYSWAGNYYPYEASKILDSDPTVLAFKSLGLGHTIGLNGNGPDFACVYFGSSSSGGIGYWNRNTGAGGSIPGSSAYVYQSAVIGDRIYFPRGHVSSAGIMVIDAVNQPAVLETTLLTGNAGIAAAGDVCTDGEHLYVRNGAGVIQKVDPAGTGAIVATFAPGVTFANMAMVGGFIYSGVHGTKNVYIVDAETGVTAVKDCSAYLPDAVGTPRWDFYNDGIWYGPQGGLTEVRKAAFVSRRIIDDL